MMKHDKYFIVCLALLVFSIIPDVLDEMWAVIINITIAGYLFAKWAVEEEYQREK